MFHVGVSHVKDTRCLFVFREFCPILSSKFGRENLYKLLQLQVAGWILICGKMGT